MATSVAITGLPVLAPASVQGDDVLPIDDVHDLTDPLGTTKQIVVNGLTRYGNRRNSLFNVLDYGAIGDGVADDTTAIQNAIAAATTNGGIVYLPIGIYLVSAQLVLPAGVSLFGAGQGNGLTLTSTRIKWTGTGFCLKAGNTPSAFSYGIEIVNLGINIQDPTAHGVTLYGVVDCVLRDVYIEGQVGSTATIGVQIDGANVSAFFILMENVTCNHVWKGFVHTTTGTTVPTQVTGINCSALCGNSVGSIGIDVQVVGGSGCGNGVSYVGGNMETCKIGVNLNANGTTITGMRFENPHGTSSDITFASNARCNLIVGCVNVFTLTNTAGSRTNQVIGVSSDTSGVVSQPNLLDATTIAGAATLSSTLDVAGTMTMGSTANYTMTPSGTNPRYFLINGTNTYAGRLVVQAGGGSNNFGAALNLYGHSHATHPGDVVAAISLGSGGKFRVNSDALDAGSDYLAVGSTGAAITGGFGCNGAGVVAKPTVTGSKGANAALASLLTALASYGLITDSST